MEDLINIERESLKESSIHSLDGRVKLIITFIIIIFAVATQSITTLILMEIYLIILIFLSNVSPSYAIKRLILILPFGGFIALFQPFIRPGDVIWAGPFGIDITLHGIIFGALLLGKVTVSVTAVILLSSTTSMQELVGSARRIGVPSDFAMLLNLTVRYLFFFYDELERIRNAQKTRCFDIWNKNVPYQWRLRKVGETIAMMFLRAYEQGERVYLSMLSRGYTPESRMYTAASKIGRREVLFVAANIMVIVVLHITQTLLPVMK
ncbi:cobalt ECF transporter T component CbiQ [Methanothermobacter sp.]|uniref:cobalt ECF transporter T component CbiQ n=1 Tax=Methanothermobacter sp. TaxID=1884223 RepID=UPI00260B32D0|nr:cobalt ECF transporter T component CbiQ [Methanothermobacter sp.]MDI9618094.1 cobalt ECF transporter T component CbiQ [Methanothermobacter sp.]